MDDSLKEEILLMEYEKNLFMKQLDDEKELYANSIINEIKRDIEYSEPIKLKPKKSYLVKKWFYDLKQKIKKLFWGENDYDFT